jgi:hypothetical protein
MAASQTSSRLELPCNFKIRGTSPAGCNTPTAMTERSMSPSIQFAIDGSNFYMRDAEGKEHKLTVEKKIAK